MILRGISAADPAFGMLREADWAVFNLLLLLRDCPGARMQTDGRTCLLAQSGPGFPLWIYLAKAPEGDLARELRGLLLERLREESGLHVNAQPDRAGALLADATRAAGAQLRVHMPLIAYTCPRIQEGPRVGRLARPRAGCAQAIADLAQVFAEDGEGQALPREEALRWARRTRTASSGRWKGRLWPWPASRTAARARPGASRASTRSSPPARTAAAATPGCSCARSAGSA